MSLFERTAKVNEIGALGLSVLAAGAWFQPAVAGSDLWWHLASGREIWTRGGVLGHDTLSYTFQGREWMNHEWLWDLLFWPLYTLHPDLVAWTQLALLFGVAALAYLAARRFSGSRLAAGLAVWLAFSAAHWFLDIRPHVVTLLFVGALLTIRHHRYAPFCWPPLVALWANLHGGFVFGVGAIGLDVLLRALEASIRERRIELPLREALGVAGSLLAMLANPWGYRILEYPLAYLDSGSPYRMLIEWHPPPLGYDPSFFQTRFWGIALLFTLCATIALRSRRRPRDLFLVALPVVALVMASTSRRFIPLFVITAAPILAAGLLDLARLVAPRLPVLPAPLTASHLRLATLPALIVAVALSWQNVRLWPDLLARWTEADLYPGAAVGYLRALGAERVLNYYNWGGYMLLHAPGTRTFIDGRANTLFDEAMLLDYRALLGGEPSWEARLARHPPPEAALLPPGRLTQLLLSLPVPWRRVYSDPIAEVLLPPGSGLVPSQAELDALRPHPQWRAGEAVAHLRRGELDLAIGVLQAVVDEHPRDVATAGRLAELHGARGDAQAIERTIRAALAANPRREESLRRFEANAYLRMRDLGRALPALRGSVVRGPFGRPERRLAQIAALERELAKGGE